MVCRELIEFPGIEILTRETNYQKLTSLHVKVLETVTQPKTAPCEKPIENLRKQIPSILAHFMFDFLNWLV